MTSMPAMESPVQPQKAILDELPKLVHLTSLCLKECGNHFGSWLTEPVLRSISRMTALTSLKLRDVSEVVSQSHGLTEEGMAILNELINLSTLHLDNTCCFEHMDVTLPALVRSLSPTLTDLNLRRAHITIKGVTALTELTNLKVLNLAEACTPLKTNAFKKISKMTTLTEINLSGSRELADVSMFKAHPNLTRLDVRDCRELKWHQVREQMEPRRKTLPSIRILYEDDYQHQVMIRLNGEEKAATRAPMQPSGGVSEVVATAATGTQEVVATAAMQEQWDREVAIHGPSITDAQLEALCTRYPAVASVNLCPESEDLTNNGIEAMLSTLTELTSLKLKLPSSGWASITKLPEVGKVTSLTTLDLEGLDKVPMMLEAEYLKNLTSLRLKDCGGPGISSSQNVDDGVNIQDTDSYLEELCMSLTALTSLKLEGGFVGRLQDLSFLGWLGNLSTLHLSGCCGWLVGNMDKVLTYLVDRYMPTLTDLNLHSAWITIKGVTALTKLTKLKVLNLSKIGMASEGWPKPLEYDSFKKISKMTTLTELDLSGSPELADVSMFKAHPNLTRLNLRNCENLMTRDIREQLAPRRKSKTLPSIRILADEEDLDL